MHFANSSAVTAVLFSNLLQIFVLNVKIWDFCSSAKAGIILNLFLNLEPRVLSELRILSPNSTRNVSQSTARTQPGKPGPTYISALWSYIFVEVCKSISRPKMLVADKWFMDFTSANW